MATRALVDGRTCRRRTGMGATGFAVGLLVAIAGCGGGASGGTTPANVPSTDAAMPTDAAILSGPYYPLTIGSSWTYKVTDPIKGVSTKVITIDAKELVPGGANAAHMAYRHTTMKDKADKTVGWLEAIELPNAGGIVIGNMYERSFKSGTDVVTENDWWEPYRTKFDESAAHTVLNAKWTETYKEFIQLGAAAVKSTTQVQSWQVLAVDESVTVPAGTFKCIKVSHSLGAAGTATTKAFWYARGVGKVLEVGGQKEELTAFTIK